MATLVFTAIGTAIGGPLGGAIGSLVGNQLDRAVAGSSRREGPRLRELAVTTSSYGIPVARHYGTMRTAGSIIWSTDLIESSESGGGGKGRPSTTTYSYSVSLAVALASRPITRLGRIWADGNLLRGAAGDLKTGGELRVYDGRGDQAPDPLIASAHGDSCPAFRGLAYCVFESLQLADFGNRIPALTFEIVADEGEVTLAQLIGPAGGAIEAKPALPGLCGFSDEGGPLAHSLAAIDDVYPLACDAGGERLTVQPAEMIRPEAPLLPEAALDEGEDGSASAAGRARRRRPEGQDVPAGLRYYDVGRDYQAGLQRAQGRASAGRARIIEFPGALRATTARDLANAAAERAGWARETLAWRVAELDPTLAPGQVVRVPGHGGYWRLDGWEWHERGIELALRRLPRGSARQTPADAGQSLPAPDRIATPTELIAFEAPRDGFGAGDARRVFAAVSSVSRGWTGAAVYAEQAGNLVPLGASGTRRSVIGHTVTALPASPAMLFDREASIDVALLAPDFQLSSVSLEALAAGANRALVGEEVLQFAQASAIEGARWRLRGLLRGRGGTEAAALSARSSGLAFVLLDQTPIAIDPTKLGAAGGSLVAIGLADNEPASAEITLAGATLRPLAPVHPRAGTTAEGGLALQWTRRARGAWAWPDGIETPLNEQAEAYLVGLGDSDQPIMRWQPIQPRLELSPAMLAQLSSEHPGQPLWVRQTGTFAVSEPLLLTLVP